MEDSLDFETLYKILRKNDLTNLSYFDDASLSDADYFSRAIKNDVISNASLIVVNVLGDNADSIGIDNNCRAIIEALAILKMNKDGCIGEEQKKNFRNQYIIVDYDNYRKIFKNNPNSHIFTEYKKQYKEAVKSLKDFYQCNECDLRKNYAKDPNFYLKKKLKDNISFYRLISKYEPFENALDMYSFFSLFCHSHYEHDEDTQIVIDKIKETYVDRILDQIEIFIKEECLDTNIDDINGFEEDYTNNPILVNNHLTMHYIDVLFNDLQKQLCIFSEHEYDRYTITYFDFLRHLFKDIQLSLSLGYKESIISKFKSFLEMASVNFFLNTAENEKEMRYLKTCFWISSGIQINKVITKKDDDDEEFKKLLSDVYENYYKEKYKCDSLDEFFENVKANSLYFASKEDKSYKNIVRNMLNKLYQNDALREEAFITYEIAGDINHAGGYSFNCNTGLIDLTPYRVIRIMCEYLLKVLPMMAMVVSEHKTGVDIVKHIKAIAEIRDKVTDKMLKISSDYLEAYKLTIKDEA